MTKTGITVTLIKPIPAAPERCSGEPVRAWWGADLPKARQPLNIHSPIDACVQSTSADRNNTAECECGQSKAPDRESCARCEFLDGPPHRHQSLAISTLRTLGPCSIKEFAAELRSAPETVQRLCTRMMRAGRLGRYQRSRLLEPRVVHVKGRTRDSYTRVNDSDHIEEWVYFLVEPRRA